VKNCEYWRLVDHEGRPPGLMGWWPSKATTFIDNHDTGAFRGYSIICSDTVSNPSVFRPITGLAPCTFCVAASIPVAKG